MKSKTKTLQMFRTQKDNTLKIAFIKENSVHSTEFHREDLIKKEKVNMQEVLFKMICKKLLLLFTQHRFGQLHPEVHETYFFTLGC